MAGRLHMNRVTGAASPSGSADLYTNGTPHWGVDLGGNIEGERHRMHYRTRAHSSGDVLPGYESLLEFWHGRLFAVEAQFEVEL